MSTPRELHFHECLGRGGFGEVYRATMRMAGRCDQVAVKVLRRDVDAGSLGEERLRDEARILMLVNHASIPRAWGITRVDGRVGTIMEYIDGVDVSRLQPVSTRAALLIVERVALALHAAYYTDNAGKPLKIVHRDIKPSNIRLCRDGQVKLLDFGIASLELKEREARTAPGDVFGSLPYLPPERLKEGECGPEQDIYGLGMTLFELLYGERMLTRRECEILPTLLDVDRFYTELAKRFDQVRARGPVINLLVQMLSHTPEDRLDASGVAVAARHLADITPGPTLAELAAQPIPPSDPIGSSSLSGRCLTDLVQLDEPRPSPDPHTRKLQILAVASGFLGMLCMVTAGAILVSLLL